MAPEFSEAPGFPGFLEAYLQFPRQKFLGGAPADELNSSTSVRKAPFDADHPGTRFLQEALNSQ